MLDYLDCKPTAYADEIQWLIFDEFNIVISDTSIYELFQRRGYTRKVVKHRAKERNKVLRDLWKTRSMNWPAAKVVCIDESASNECTG